MLSECKEGILSKMSRSKGRKGETIAKNLLKDNDWNVLADLTSGIDEEDLVAECPLGKIYCIEVKNRKLVNIPEFRKQAIKNANKKKKAWMIMVKIEGSKSWLIWRQGEKPSVWHEKKEKV